MLDKKVDKIVNDINENVEDVKTNINKKVNMVANRAIDLLDFLIMESLVLALTSFIVKIVKR